MKHDGHSTQERIERALQELPREMPAPDLAARIVAQLPQTALSHAANRRLMAITLIAALLGLLLVFRTAFELHRGGALDLISFYAAQPAIVTTYPGEALGALAQVIPWVTVLQSASVLLVALWLVSRLTANARWNLKRA